MWTVVYIVANMANACNPSTSQRSSSGRQTSHARVGGTDEQELAEYKLGHVNLEGAVAKYCELKDME